MVLLHDTATLLRSSGHWYSFIALPHCRGAVGSGSPAAPPHTAGEQWAVGLFSTPPYY